MFSSSSGPVAFVYLGAAVLIVLAAAGILHIGTSIVERRLRSQGRALLYARILSTIRGPATLMVATFGLLPALLLLRGAAGDNPALRLFTEYESLAVRIWLAIIACEISWFASRFLQALIRWYVRSVSKGTATDLDRKLLHTTVITLFVNCGVSYQSNLEHVERVALEILNEVKDDLEEAEDDFEPVIRFTTFGESNIDFVLVIQARDRLDSFVVKHELIKRLHVRFGQEGIEINYPVRKLVND